MTTEHGDSSPQLHRGAEIKRRRLRHGITSLHEFAAATGVSRKAVTAAERGVASVATYERLEAWLDRFDEETGGPAEPTSVEQIEFTVEGDFGVKVTVKGPITDHEVLRADVAEIIRSIREGRPEV